MPASTSIERRARRPEPNGDYSGTEKFYKLGTGVMCTQSRAIAAHPESYWFDHMGRKGDLFVRSAYPGRDRQPPKLVWQLSARSAPKLCRFRPLPSKVNSLLIVEEKFAFNTFTREGVDASQSRVNRPDLRMLSIGSLPEMWRLLCLAKTHHFFNLNPSLSTYTFSEARGELGSPTS
jgi:hypothetical protein